MENCDDNRIKNLRGKLKIYCCYILPCKYSCIVFDKSVLNIYYKYKCKLYKFLKVGLIRKCLYRR